MKIFLMLCQMFLMFVALLMLIVPGVDFLNWAFAGIRPQHVLNDLFFLVMAIMLLVCGWFVNR